jgi:very-short-patch-repair endonuclease
MDVRHAPGAREDCEVACYDCLMSYFNQGDHRLLDRHSIREFLMSCSRGTTSTSPQASSRAEQMQQLLNLSQSDLEREWLNFMDSNNCRLPSHAQNLIEECHTRPDYLYEEHNTVIYVDGPYHDYPERHKRDVDQQNCLEDAGYTVIRFGTQDDWEKMIQKYPSVFGTGSSI